MLMARNVADQQPIYVDQNWLELVNANETHDRSSSDEKSPWHRNGISIGLKYHNNTNNMSAVKPFRLHTNIL